MSAVITQSKVLGPVSNGEIMTPMRRLNREMKTRSRKTRRSFNNDFSLLNPTIWANEAIVQLLPNMVIGNLVSRDYSSQVAKFGDIVNAFVPGQFTMTKKGAVCDNVVIQDATASDVQVALDQWPQVSFMICDGEENRDQLDLLNALLTPAVIAMATGIDQVLTSQVYQFLPNVGGHVNNMDSTNVRQYLLEARETMNRNNVPDVGRTLLLSPGSETSALNVDAFTFANESADNGLALTRAVLGRKFGFDIFMTQTEPEITSGQTTIGTVTCNGPVAAGTSTMVFAGAQVASVVVGMWCVIAGDDVPRQILVNAANTVTLDSPLKRSVLNNAVVTILAGGLVNNANGYPGTTTSPRALGWNKEILTSGWTAGSPPQVGQMISFGTTQTKYTINKVRVLSTTQYGLTLDRPLVAAVANSTVINLGSSGKFNFAFLPGALTMVNRPLPQPRAGSGALSKVVQDPVNKISLRINISYDAERQGHLVTLDTLIGVGVVNKNLGVVLLG